MKAIYLKFAVLKPKRDLKKEEDLTLSDYVITEESLTGGFERVFGKNSVILGKCIYILMSNLRDNIAFNFLEFIKYFTGLFVSKT